MRVIHAPIGHSFAGCLLDMSMLESPQTAFEGSDTLPIYGGPGLVWEGDECSEDGGAEAERKERGGIMSLSGC